jgi:hypothetical protein
MLTIKLGQSAQPSSATATYFLGPRVVISQRNSESPPPLSKEYGLVTLGTANPQREPNKEDQTKRNRIPPKGPNKTHKNGPASYQQDVVDDYLCSDVQRGSP